MKILHLTLKKKWYDMIESGEKTTEYREDKPYWQKRLLRYYDAVHFRNGYSRNARTMMFLINSIVVGRGFVVWGARPDRPVFKIYLGERLSLSKNAQKSHSLRCATGGDDCALVRCAHPPIS